MAKKKSSKAKKANKGSGKKKAGKKKVETQAAEPAVVQAAADMGDQMQSGPYANLSRALSVFVQEIGRDPKEAYREVKLIWQKMTGGQKKKKKKAAKKS